MAGYSDFQIGIVPVIKPVDGVAAAAGTAPRYLGDAQADQGYIEGDVEGVTTLEDCKDLSNMVWNLPGMFLGDHLERTEEQTDKFAKELYKYCIKKGIDPSDYVFDEFGLVTATFILGSGLWKDHKAHKREASDTPINKPVDAGTAAEFNTGKGVTSSGGTAEYSEPEDKHNANPASSSGGDMIETEEEP